MAKIRDYKTAVRRIKELKEYYEATMNHLPGFKENKDRMFVTWIQGKVEKKEV